MISSILETTGYTRLTFLNSEAPVLTELPVTNEAGEEIFRAGQFVPAGNYQQVDGERVVSLEAAGYLPPSFDGHRAEYCRVERPWILMYSAYQELSDS